MIEILLLILVALVFYRTFPRFTTVAFFVLIVLIWIQDLSLSDLKAPLAFTALGAYCALFFMFGGILMDWVFRRKPGLSSFFNKDHAELHPCHPVSEYSKLGQVIYAMMSALIFFILMLVVSGVLYSFYLWLTGN